MNLLIKNALIVSSGEKEKEPKDIYIENGIIKKIDKNINKDNVKVLDGKQKYVLPGFIDLFCKLCKSGYENKNNITMISDAALRGGFTSITTSPLTQPLVDNKTVVEYIYSELKEKDIINIYTYGSMTKRGEGEKIAEIGEMLRAGAIAISDGGKKIKNTAILKDIFNYSKMFEVTLITSCMGDDLSINGVAHYGYMATKLGLIGIPREAEEIEVSRNIILAKYTGAKIHIPVVTTKGSLDLIRQAKKDGVKVTCGTCPHYFTLTEEELEDYNTFAKVLPPLRTKDDILAIKQGIKERIIDVISSGHEPALKENKITEFENAEFGISGLEVCFPILNTELVSKDIIKIEDVSLLMALNPAKILGLKNKGEIKEGFDADIILVDLETPNIVDSSKFSSRARYSPYDGMSFKGKVLNTIVKGKILY